jgi:hypothetical protein
MSEQMSHLMQLTRPRVRGARARTAPSYEARVQLQESGKSGVRASARRALCVTVAAYRQRRFASSAGQSCLGVADQLQHTGFGARVLRKAKYRPHSRYYGGNATGLAAQQNYVGGHHD